jgi:outer membrane protein X
MFRASARIAAGAVLASALLPLSALAAEPLESPAPAPDVAPLERKQPLVVVHSGVAGLWGHGTQSFGIGAVVEPKWNITDSIAAGLRVDGGVVFGGRIVPRGTTSVAMGAMVGTLLKGEYLLGSSGVRPFVGLGAGMYTLVSQGAAVGDEGAGVNQSVGRFYGLAPQLGVDFGGVRLGVTYNYIVGGELLLEQDVNAGLSAQKLPRNYIQLELSFRSIKIGGPRDLVGGP